MENKKSSKQENGDKRPVLLNNEQQQNAYFPHLYRTVADTRSKTCGIIWKLHLVQAEEDREQ
jgi:hypothetical protein